MVGPLTVRDLSTGEALVELEGFCDHAVADAFTGIPADDPALQTCGPFDGDPPFTFSAWAARWSPDGRFIAAVDGSMGGVGIWDATTGRIVHAVGTADDTDADGRTWDLLYDGQFTAGSDGLLLTTFTGHLVAVDTTTWDVVEVRQLDQAGRSSAGLVGSAADGSVVVVNPLRQNEGDTSVVLLDPVTLRPVEVWSDVAEGTVQSVALSPDATRIALATRDGVVSVWDLGTQTLLDRADPGLASLEGVQWLDDSNLVVISLTGHLSTVSTDAGLLLDLARSTLTRGLTQSECTTYEITPCPSLAALRRSDPTVPEELRGSYELTWSADDLRRVAAERVSSAYGELDQPTQDAITAQAELLAGDYRLDLGISDYTMTRNDGDEVWCTGAVSGTTTRPDRLLLGAASGSGCVDFHYAEVGWELDDEELVLPPEEFRGGYFDSVLWTGAPLRKVG